MTESESPDGGVTIRDWAAAALLVEAAALMIALATAFIPGRGQTTWSPADLFLEDPGQLVRVVATFLLVNALVALLGAVAWIGTRVRSGG